MARRNESELKPRDGHLLKVGIFARISGCQDQKEQSLDDQIAHAKEAVRELYSGPVKFKIIKVKAKGERLDRRELKRLRRLLRSRRLDLLVMEDLGRLVRGVEAVKLLGIAVDHETRVIVLHDGIDTVEPGWEEDAISASRDHVSNQTHTSKRIKKKMMNRFLRFGGTAARPIAGYIVPPGAKTYDDWQIDPSATPIILEGAQRLRESLNCSELADWFNTTGFQRGPLARNQSWHGHDVRNFYANPLLIGRPGRGFRHTVKHHETGKRVSVKNPNGPQFYVAEHLRHLPDDLFEELNAKLAASNAHYRRPLVNGVDDRKGVPRKRTKFPGQFARCLYCGRVYVWGANGVTANLMCSGSRTWNCWNSIGFSGELACRKITEAICHLLRGLDGFESQFRELVADAQQARCSGLDEKWSLLQRDEALLFVQRENVQRAIVDCGPTELVKQLLAKVESQQRELAHRRRQLERLAERKLHLPDSPASLLQALEEEFQRLAIDSPEFGRLLQRLVPEFYVYAVRLCDGGPPQARAKLTLNLAGVAPDLNLVPGLESLLTPTLTLDLFDLPQRVRHLADCVRLQAAGLQQREIAVQLPEPITQTAVYDALALHRKMQVLHLTDPYLTLLEPPADYKKLRRHNHPRYEFKPLPDYKPPVL